MTNEKLWIKIERGLRNSTPNCQLQFEVELVGHCNLNCKQCTHFSPLVEEEFVDISSYKNDIDRLSELFDGEMFSIFLMGGEPLLHPQVTEIMQITRDAFPIGKILLVTNGLLLPSMQEDFWEACKKYDVIIEPTCYPVDFDYAGLKKLADSKCVKYTPFDVVHNTQYKLFPIRSSGGEQDRSSIKNHFLNCSQATVCTTLKNGKMYICSAAPYAPRLKKYFNLDIHLSEKDGIDIYSVKNGDELLEKLSRPIPFCKYCDITDECIRSDWGISKRDRYEWLAFEFTEDDMQYLKSKKTIVYVFGASKYGTRAVYLLKTQGIAIRNVLVTRKKQGIDNILGVPIIALDKLIEVEPNSICLVALQSPINKSEVYPLLSQMGFRDIIPIS